MPLTPFHWSVSVFAFAFPRFFYLPALLVSSVIVDLEPFWFLFISPNEGGVLHGFFHTFLGAFIAALLVFVVLVLLRAQIDAVFALFRFPQLQVSNAVILFSSVFAAFSHVLLDSFLYNDIRPFTPFSMQNPFFGFLGFAQTYLLCSVLLAAAGVMYFVRIAKVQG